MTGSAPDGQNPREADGEREELTDGGETAQSRRGSSRERFDWRGWTLVGVIVVSFLVVPGAILYLPHAQDVVAAVGLSWYQAYIVLPMIPAVLLGATAIWAALSSRSPSE